MILFPAIDLKDGKCVRLQQGKEDLVTVYADSPVEQALLWEKKGAKWIHLIDLDGAFSGIPKNLKIIEDICKNIKIPIQLGGGIRDIATAEAYLDAGITRLIIGTMALENPEEYRKLCQKYPNKIGVSLDAVDGKLKTHGWVTDANINILEILPRIEADGTAFIIYTDIIRDGMQSGINYDTLAALCESTTVPVIAAGGMHVLGDFEAVYPLFARGLEGVISGKALYEGTLTIEETEKWLSAVS